MESKSLISVIICTYNNCASLKDTLDSLLIQESDQIFDHEVIVVDNNSKDKTKETVEFYMPKFNGRLRYIFESNQGLSYARNRGIKESKGEIIAFTDDDVIVDKGWILNIYKCFRNYNCDAIGGRVLPLYPRHVPKWILEHEDLLRGPIVIHDYGESVEIYDSIKMRPFIGANMSFRKNCFAEVGMFRNDMGAGTETMGEDTNFFKRLKSKGKLLYYCGKSVAYHKTENDRTTYLYIAKWFFKLGRYYAREDFEMKKEKKLICYWGIPRYLIRKCMENVVSSLFSLIYIRKFLRCLIMLCKDIGQCYEYRKLFLDKGYKYDNNL